MALGAQFDRELRKLFNRRVAWLPAAIAKTRPGPASLFAKKVVIRKIDHLPQSRGRSCSKKRGMPEFRAALSGDCSAVF